MIEKLTDDMDLTKKIEYKLNKKAESSLNILDNTLEKERLFTERHDERKVEEINLSIADDLSVRPYTEYHYNSDNERKDDIHNNSTFEHLKKSLKRKPPHPVLNDIYKKSNKEMLEKMHQKIFKKEKRLTEENN